MLRLSRHTPCLDARLGRRREGILAPIIQHSILFFFFLFLPISQQPSINCKWRGILQHVQQRQNPRRRIRDRQGEHGARRVKAKKLSIFPMLSNRKIDEKQQKKINTVAIITRNKRVKTNSHFQIQNIKIHPGKVKLVHSTPRKRG